MFQFLIGTIKTFHSTYLDPCILLVSIPYRYDKNPKGIVHLESVLSKFQFLIGTIKTNYNLSDVIAWAKFQFLIGTIKTRKFFPNQPGNF